MGRASIIGSLIKGATSGFFGMVKSPSGRLFREAFREGIQGFTQRPMDIGLVASLGFRGKSAQRIMTAGLNLGSRLTGLKGGIVESMTGLGAGIKKLGTDFADMPRQARKGLSTSLGLGVRGITGGIGMMKRIPGGIIGGFGAMKSGGGRLIDSITRAGSDFAFGWREARLGATPGMLIPSDPVFLSAGLRLRSGLGSLGTGVGRAATRLTTRTARVPLTESDILSQLATARAATGGATTGPIGGVSGFIKGTFPKTSKAVNFGARLAGDFTKYGTLVGLPAAGMGFLFAMSSAFSGSTHEKEMDVAQGPGFVTWSKMKGMGGNNLNTQGLSLALSDVRHNPIF